MKITGNCEVNLKRLYKLYKKGELTEEQFDLCCRHWGVSPEKAKDHFLPRKRILEER